MIDERAYWVWLQQAFGAGSPKPMRLHRRTPGGVKAFCDGGAKLWNSSRSLTDREATALREFTLQQAESRLEYALKLGWQVITPIDPSYPPLLLEIDAPPAVLYVKGKLPDWNSCLPISVAGSRKATKESVDFARKLGYELAAGGATVISGGAAGIDAAAMTGALTLPGAGVVSVLPVSLDSNYLMANAGLRKSICERGGALVSEYFGQNVPAHGTFPIRNRLITGMSRGVVLVQAAKKSGTMLYAGHAADQNRDVFVYEGAPGDPAFAGSAELLDDGALPATCGEDVLTEYRGAVRKPHEPVLRLFEDLTPTTKPILALADAASDLTAKQLAVWEVLGAQPLSIAELEERTGFSTAELFGVLTELELEGYAHSLPGKRYTR